MTGVSGEDSPVSSTHSDSPSPPGDKTSGFLLPTHAEASVFQAKEPLHDPQARPLPVRIFSIVTLLLLSALIVTAQNPVPFISQPLVPSAIAPNVPGITFALTVNGTGFVFRLGGELERSCAAHSVCKRLEAIRLHSLLGYGAGQHRLDHGSESHTRRRHLNLVFLPINNPTSTVSFEPPANYTVGECPQYIATADFRRMGKLDLVSANDCSGNVSVLLGNGDGTFQPQAQYSAGGGDSQAPIVGVSTGTEYLILLHGVRLPSYWVAGMVRFCLRLAIA